MKKKTGAIVLAALLIIGCIFVGIKLNSKNDAKLSGANDSSTNKVEDKNPVISSENESDNLVNKVTDETNKEAEKELVKENDKDLVKEDNKDSSRDGNKDWDGYNNQGYKQTNITEYIEKEDKKENSDVKSEKEKITVEGAIKSSIEYIKNKKTLNDWDIVALTMANNKSFAKESLKGKAFLEDKRKDIKESIDEYSLTDYAKTVLMLNALGENPYDFEGINLIEKTKALVKEKGQLINAHIWGIIALEASNAEYDVKDSINYLHSSQNKDGGFPLILGIGESEKAPDVTAMAVYAMAMIDKNDSNIDKAINYIESYLKLIEKESKYKTAESLSQVIMALVSAEKDINTYTINSKSIIDELLEYVSEEGGFKHSLQGDSNNIATQQALTALMFYKNDRNLFENLSAIVDKEDNKLVEAEIILKDNETFGSEKVDKPLEHKGNIKIQGNGCLLKNLKLEGDIVISLDKGGVLNLQNVKAKNITINSKEKIKLELKSVDAERLVIDTNEKSEIDINGNFSSIEILSKCKININGKTKIEKLNNAIEAEVKKSEESIIKDESTQATKNLNKKATMTIIGYRRTVLSSHEFNIEVGDTVASAIKRVLNETGIDYGFSSNDEYISRIDGQKERDIGPLSGWKYSVNGDFPSVPVTEMKIKEGDSIKFIYVNSSKDTEGIDSSEYEMNKPKIIVSGISNGDILSNSTLQFQVEIEDNEDETLKPTVVFNGLDISNRSKNYNVQLKEGVNEITVTVKDSEGFMNEESITFTYKKNGTNQGGGSNTDGGTKQSEDEIKILEGNVEVAVKTTDGGKLLLNNQSNEKQRLKVIIYDDKNNVEYINDIIIENGKKEVNLFLKVDEYVGEFKLNDSDKSVKKLEIK